jgi:hypothetical protein
MAVHRGSCVSQRLLCLAPSEKFLVLIHGVLHHL